MEEREEALMEGSEAIPKVRIGARPQGETPRLLRNLSPPRIPSQSHTFSMALFLVREGSACLPLLRPLQNWDPSSTGLAGWQCL